MLPALFDEPVQLQGVCDALFALAEGDAVSTARNKVLVLRKQERDLRAKAVEKWLSANHAVAHNSNLQTVLQRMHEKKITKVYVINTDDGFPLGSVHITDLCRKLLRDEAAQKINGFGAFRRRRHLDIVVQNVDV